MRKISLFMATMVLAVFAFSCKQQESTTPLNNNGLSQEVIEQFKTLGFDARGGSHGVVTNPLTGKQQTGYSFEDVFISDEQFKEMLSSPVTNGPNKEQYRTFNLVNAPRTISVIGYTGNNANGLGNNLRNALRQAVARYNSESLSLRFTLTFGTNYPPFDIVVYQVPNNAIGASAGFPSGGNPYKWVRMNSGVNNTSLQTARHIVMHEMGHCIGFRHTDWFNRSISCGGGGSEGSGSIGAVHIPGTTTGADTQSVMLSCGGLGTPGAFSSQDRTALNFLY